ncbi:MAG: sigma-70 family RNA polymerase sigma factor [Clostridia bacterium]|nr:sigma-70 family RNA polymerase sigma factor [Clostridia bacterium]
MDLVSYGDFRLPDAKNDDYRPIDCECAACLYEAGMLAVSDVLAAVINNELTETERTVVQRYWFSGEKISRIAASSGVSDDSVRKSLKRAQKKIYASLKYVVLYNSVIGSEDKLPENFGFKIVRNTDGKELMK